jgi:hypothetical protein
LHDAHKEACGVKFDWFAVFGSDLRIGDEVVLGLGVVADEVKDVIVLKLEWGYRGF